MYPDFLKRFERDVTGAGPIRPRARSQSGSRHSLGEAMPAEDARTRSVSVPFLGAGAQQPANFHQGNGIFTRGRVQRLKVGGRWLG